VPTHIADERPPEVRVEIVAGHLTDGLDVPCVLGEQRDHARQDQQDERPVEVRQVPAHRLLAVGEDFRVSREAQPVGALDAAPVDAVVVGRLGRAAEH
jgi:hypothetical protein